ncbi:dTDP-glucose 4,6-dehydratase [Pirellula sp. SH-Sr6A]|uniref:NAD-dependent epimerase/dehydratase family protein n=1 Tax=Pirellula sp. SH-Sr6A TaxID=1632865 RepID=UPI00078C21C0|nr:NAD-dependent epimerase/dehydratase family protein [Pirellula sp. SH-Sr6A]AMV33866.1 dTDP-glucose 4,6-dehydratase [Pirellula sp. SH-Sr6A]
MRILITGGSGFIGSHLTDYLLAQNHSVIVVDDFSTGSRNNLKHLRGHSRLEVIDADLGNPQLVRDVCEGADQVYHLAAAVGVALIAKQPIQTIHRNIYPTQLLLDELRRIHLAGKPVPLYLASTSEVYGKNPKSIWNENDDLVFGSTTKPRWSYGASKAIDEFLALACVRECGMKIIVGRFFNVVGPRQTGAYGMVLPRFVAAAMKNQPIVVHDDGHQERCFAHVRDVVLGFTTLMNTESAFGRIYNIGADSPISILELAQRVQQIVNPNAPIEFQSYARAYDEDFEDIRRRVPDLTRIREAIGYSPCHSIDDIIRDVWCTMQSID